MRRLPWSAAWPKAGAGAIARSSQRQLGAASFGAASTQPRGSAGERKTGNYRQSVEREGEVEGVIAITKVVQQQQADEAQARQKQYRVLKEG